jgi:hypothetical protein
MSAILITDGGEHSAETLAMRAADLLLPNESEVTKGRELEAATARLKIALALVGPHGDVRASEAASLGADAGRFGDDIDVSAHMANALGAVRQAVADGPFAGVFDGEAEARAAGILATAFSTTVHMARQVAAKASPSAEGDAFLATHNG